MHFDHIYPRPSSSSLPLSLNFKVFFLSATRTQIQTSTSFGQHSEYVQFKLLLILAKRPAFSNFPRQMRHKSEINGGLLLFKCHVDGVIICANKTHCHLILTCSSLNYASFFCFFFFALSSDSLIFYISYSVSIQQLNHLNNLLRVYCILSISLSILRVGEVVGK